MALQMIPANDFCLHHHIEVSFLHSLHDYGFITIITTEDDVYLEAEQLELIEKLVRLHFDLHINLEGIDVVQHLLEKMEQLQAEMRQLKNKLQLYESE